MNRHLVLDGLGFRVSKRTIYISSYIPYNVCTGGGENYRPAGGLPRHTPHSSSPTYNGHPSCESASLRRLKNETFVEMQSLDRGSRVCFIYNTLFGRCFESDNSCSHRKHAAFLVEVPTERYRSSECDEISPNPKGIRYGLPPQQSFADKRFTARWTRRNATEEIKAWYSLESIRCNQQTFSINQYISWRCNKKKQRATHDRLTHHISYLLSRGTMAHTLM